MKYLLLSLSVFLLLYATYIFVKCIEVSNNLTNFGKGYFTGSILLICLGFFILYLALKNKTTKK